MKKLLMALLVSCLAISLLVLAGCKGNEPAVTTGETTTGALGTTDQNGTTVLTTATAPITTTASPVTTNAGGDANKPEDDTMRILFLGNSLMFYNDMPETFKAMAKAAGKEVYIQSVLDGGSTIAKYADPAHELGVSARKMIGLGNWDYIVIQPSRRATPWENTVLEREIEAAKTIKGLADGIGAKIVIYSVWGNNSGKATAYTAVGASGTESLTTKLISRPAHAKFMYEFGLRVASELGEGVTTVYAGLAFENCIALNPDINLYHTDYTHPSPEGSYLAAATFYATLFGEKSLEVGYKHGINSYKELCTVADKTVLEGRMPDFKEPEVSENADQYRILYIGSALINDYAMAEVLEKVAKESVGKEIYSQSLTSGSYTNTLLTDPAKDLGFRDSLLERWDAVVIQITRRCTPSSPDVAESELAALKSVWDTIVKSTSNVYIFALNGSDGQSIFTTKGGELNYTKTSNKETYTSAEMSKYYADLAKAWAEELGCKYIDYANGYTDLSAAGIKNATTVGYLQACSLFYSIFGEEIPETSKELNGLSASVAAEVRKIAIKRCPITKE